jgi:hypothetical protein
MSTIFLTLSNPVYRLLINIFNAVTNRVLRDLSNALSSHLPNVISSLCKESGD